MARLVFAAAVVLGAVAAWYYARAGLALSHYDARAHLVVARRVIDSLTPGWQQFGAVWLPLPHVINFLPVQWDWSYRTGFSAVAFSIGVLAWGLAALSRYLLRHVGSAAVAFVAPLALLANPGVLYLQSTPMTEPLLFGFALLALAAVDDWIARPGAPAARRAAAFLVALMLTRYEGWLITAALVGIAMAASRSPRTGSAWLLLTPPAAVAGFLLQSYFSSRVLLVTGGFFVPDNPARGDWALAIRQVLSATFVEGGAPIVAAGLLGVLVALGRARRIGLRALLPLSLLGAAVLPLSAFHAGHPERVRYMVALVVAGAALAGLAFAALPKRVRAAAAILFFAASIAVRPPLSRQSPMVLEAQWEEPFRVGRREVSVYLQTHHDGTPIMASMGSLAHYMQDTIAFGLPLRAFLHEGNEKLWASALVAPRRHVRWILIEERALGGDMLARRAREDKSFLSGFRPAASGGGLVLYRLAD